MPYEINEKDNHGLGTGKTPYVSFTVTKDFAEKVKNKKLVMYEVDGDKFFALHDKDGKDTGKMCFFACFID